MEPRGPARRRAIPSISKSREEEIRKILRSNLQKTRQRVGKVLESLAVSLACMQVLTMKTNTLQTHVSPCRPCVSPAPFLQQTWPADRPVWGQREWSSLQEAEGGDGEEGEFNSDCGSVRESLELNAGTRIIHRWGVCAEAPALFEASFSAACNEHHHCIQLWLNGVTVQPGSTLERHN